MTESEKNDAIVEEEKKRTAAYLKSMDKYGVDDYWNRLFFYSGLVTDVILVFILWRLW